MMPQILMSLFSRLTLGSGDRQSRTSRHLVSSIQSLLSGRCLDILTSINRAMGNDLTGPR